MSSQYEQAQRHLANQVKASRKALGISQEELAHQAGIDRTYASQIERGIGNPSLRVVCAVADALGVKLKDLIG